MLINTLQKLNTPIDSHDHRTGLDHALVSLVEYGDYECPHSGKFHRIIQQLKAQFGDQLKYVYRHFPLRQLHPHAQKAAEAAEAAGTQGKFWEMHDLLMTHQADLGVESLIQHAKRLQIDSDLFEKQLRSGVLSPRVTEDFQTGVKSGVNETPTLFINGMHYTGPLHLDPLTSSIEREMDEETIRRAI